MQSTGAPTTLAGSPVISAYPDNSTTQLTAGITLSVDFDSVTGLNNVRVVATGANGYLQGSNYQLVITTGTVNSVSAVGYVVGQFSIQARSNSSIGAGVGSFPPLGIIDAGTLQSATGTTAVIRSASNFTANDEIKGATIQITSGTGVGQARLITAYTVASDTVTVDTWTTNPDSTSTYIILGTPPGSATAPPPVNTTFWNGTAVASPATAGIPDVNVKNIDNDAASASGTVTFPNATLASTTNITGGIITTVTNLTNAPTSGDLTATMKTSVTTAATAATPTVATVSGSVGSVAGNVGGNVVGSVGSVTGAVGSVTGNVGGNVAGSVASVVADVGITQAGADKVWGTATRTLTAGTNLSIPTATQNADALLDRDMSVGTDSGTATIRTPRQAFRILRNRVNTAVSPAVIYKEDDATQSWTTVLTTDVTALPIVTSDPTGP